MPSFRMHEPIFPADRALYIISCDDWQGERYSLPAGHLSATLAAWHAMADDTTRDRLSLQFGSWVLRTRYLG